MIDSERVRAIGNWAYLKVLPRKVETAAGIIMPEAQAEKVGYCLARVLSLGPGEYKTKAGRRVRDTGVQEKDVVYVRRYLTEINPSDATEVEFCFIDQKDLIAVTNEDADITVVRI